MLKVQSPRQILVDDAIVHELIDQGVKWCNMELIGKIFTPEERVVINRLLVSCSSQKDVLIWRGTARGEFLVQSAYHMEKKR